MLKLLRYKSLFIFISFSLIFVLYQNCTPQVNHSHEVDFTANSLQTFNTNHINIEGNGDGYTGKVKYVSHPVDNPCYDSNGLLAASSVVTEFESNLYLEKRNCQKVFPEAIDVSAVQSLTSDGEVVKINGEIYQEINSFATHNQNSNAQIQELYCAGSVAGSLYSAGELVMTLEFDDTTDGSSYNWLWSLNATYAADNSPYTFADEDYSVYYGKVGNLDIFNEDAIAEEEQRLDLNRSTLTGRLWGSKILRDTGLPYVDLGCSLH